MADTKVYLSGERIQGASTDATGAVDSLGTAVNGSNSGCVTSSDTPFYGETSVTFDDNDAAHLFGSTSSFAGLMKEDFTVTFWAKCSGKGNMGWGQGTNPGSSPYAGNQGCVLCLGQISGGGNGFVISFDDNNTNQFFVCAGDGSNVPLNDTQNDGADHDNNYHLYMFHFDNTNEELRVYRDGSATPRDTTAYAMEITSTAATTYDELYMGRQNIDDVRYYIGQLADVSIWKRLLTTAEFTQLWGTFADNTATATTGGSAKQGVRVNALTNQAGLLAHWKLDDLNFTNSAIKTDLSKTSITDVPLGTRYEQTDTLEIFRYGTTGRAWTNPQSKYSISGNAVTRTASSNWDGYCIAPSGDLPAANPTIIEITNASASEMVCFTWLDSSDDPRGVSSAWDENVIAFGFYFSDQVRIRVDGSDTNGYTYSGQTYTTSDVFKIEMTSTTVTFYKQTGGTGSFALLHTCNSTSGSGSSSQVPDASKTYYALVNIHGNAGTMSAKNPTDDWIAKGTTA